ncbi:hypothetical protein A2U01_0078877, partial [Trifolium medium]|nr:hypothetical protein [Trifolium medium]
WNPLTSLIFGIIDDLPTARLFGDTHDTPVVLRTVFWSLLGNTTLVLGSL